MNRLWQSIKNIFKKEEKITPYSKYVSKMISLQMESKKFKVGDKVTPISKSIGVSFDICSVFKYSKNIGQNYLYITEIRDGNIICSHEMRIGGNSYLEKDLIKYKKILEDV